jgi:hypothetical protein
MAVLPDQTGRRLGTDARQPRVAVEESPTRAENPG